MQNNASTPYQQTDFLTLLFKERTPVASATSPTKRVLSPRQPLSPKQQAGFRHDYNQAMITLYVIGCLFPTQTENIPEPIKHEMEKAKKTQDRYERYSPKAKQNIIHFGREVVDAAMYNDSELMELRREAEKARYPDKQQMYDMAQNTLNKMVRIIQEYNRG